jgi:hypothetical protein
MILVYIPQMFGVLERPEERDCVSCTVFQMVKIRSSRKREQFYDISLAYEGNCLKFSSTFGVTSCAKFCCVPEF